MKKSIRTFLLISIIFLSFYNCDSKKKDISKVEVSEKDKINKQIIFFLKNNKSITEKTYNDFYISLIKKDYILNRDNNKYRMLINAAKKTFNEKNLSLKNTMYNNFKNEFLKNN